MLRSSRLVAIGFTCWAFLATSAALAWNSSGHLIVGLIAYDEMNEATRGKVIDLLRAHPRFVDHFERFMPRAVQRGNDRETNEWLFAHAGTWPDIVRDARGSVSREDVTRFNRPWWHFINRPIYLNDAERRNLEPHLRQNLRRDPPDDHDDPEMNVIQAVKNSARIVQDKTAPAESRSVHLCWLIHLTGDSHQPLHSSALYTAHRFRDGDHGGNFLQFEHEWDLHAFWDSQISTDERYETIRVLAADLRNNPELTAAAQRAAGSLEIDDWIAESHELCKQYVYTPEMMQKIADREGHSHLGPLDLPPTYLSDAETVAERRAVEAAHRLAKLLERLLN
ncbi:MAG: S1/P1 nuclease [Planctomycetes bacterium]|nr:S1/P1 nuclease [Planctomycetota bacterium]